MYQIHIPSPRYGSCDLPPPFARASPPVAPPDAAPVGRTRAKNTTAAARAASARRACRPCRRERVGAPGRLPAGLRLVLAARIWASTAARAELPRPDAVARLVSR